MAAAFEIPILNVPFGSGEDDSAAQFKGVTLDSNGHTIVQTSGGGNIVGVLQNKPTATQQATVMVQGVTKMVAGAALTTPGTVLKVDTSGRAVSRGGSGTAIGTLLTAAAGAGDLCTVLLQIQPQ